MFYNKIGTSKTIFLFVGSLYYLDEVYVDGCSALPCIFTRGSRQNFTFKLYAGIYLTVSLCCSCILHYFLLEFESTELIQNAVFIYKGLKYPMEVDPTALCGKSLNCPVKHGQDASFTSYLTVNSTLPSTSVSTNIFYSLFLL